MRVQNEGTGKSSWWMINPDAKPGKSVRRRAASMETSKFEKRRGRVKKKVEAMRVGSGLTTSITGDNHSSPGSSVSEGLDLFPDSPIHSSAGFQLSPDFRQRASSNASSCGRLSPIPSLHGAEPDWTTSGSAGYNPPNDYQPQQQPALDQLAGNLAESMKLQNVGDYMQGFVNSGNQHIPPPPYQQPYGTSPYGLPQCPLHRIQNCGCMHSCDPRESLSPSSCPGMSPSYPQSEPSPDPMGGAQYLSTGGECSPSQGNSSPPSSQTSTLLLRRNGTILEQQNQAPSTMMGQLMGALNNSALLDDLNINIETIPGGFDCNVDELTKHELSMDGSLDFNFQSQAAAAAAMAAHHQQQQQHNHHQLGGNHLQHLHHQHLHHHAGGSVQLASGTGLGGSDSSRTLGDGGVNGNGARGVAVSSQSAQYSASVTPPSWVH
ncbi:forkhead box protein O-like [Ctenocephalides felis]|uniref:forkhead box protein O-like n=1 Tax=Ctenocephalides felis TaxID=7515 RepID=UPI000E6E2B6D|nr:forkhead box protein O-like [Ctenocephalides felis]